MMSQDSNDTSSISFTAHYTGYVWYKQGWSDIRLTTRQGARYFQALRPVEWLARTIVGTDIKSTLLQRHALIDRELVRNIEAHRHTQVLEIAAGLSPRGFSFRQRYPQLGYTEADLPAMAQRKRQLLSTMQADTPLHRTLTCNILNTDSADSLENLLMREFDHSQPITVITEGLVNYFPRPVMNTFWTRLANALRDFPEACYLTDVYPEVQQHRFARLIQKANRLLGWVTRSNFSLHFRDHHEAEQQFLACGFSQLQVFDPNQELAASHLPVVRGGAVVRVIRADLHPSPTTA